jgi:hypothetical protein
MAPVWAQTGQNKLEVLLPAGAPLSVVSSEWGESQARAQGAGMMIDLKTNVRFRNNSKLRLRGISLEVKTEQVAAGGKASLSVPSLDVYPGQDFPVRIDLRLLQAAGKANAAVRVYLDGALFEDLSFFGPNHLQSRRTLTAWELEARRDRQWLRQVLASRGEAGLRQEILETLARDTRQPHLGVRVARGPASLGAGESVKLAFRQQTESPVEGFEAEALRNGQELRIPEIRVANRAEREIRFVEYMLLARDAKGRMLAAGSLPSPVQLKAKEQGTLRGNVAIELSRLEGGPIQITGLTGVVQKVEYANGDVWIPSLQGLEETGLRADLPPSLELQRLADIYRKRNIAVLIEELKRFD